MTKHLHNTIDSVQVDDQRTPLSITRIPWWISTIVILGALLTLAGAVISKVDSTMLTNGGPMTGAAQIYADYLFARDLPLAVMLFLFLALRARQILASFMLLTAFIQLVDVIDNLTRGAFMLVPGLLVFAIAFLIGAWWLFTKTEPQTLRAS